MGKTGAAAPVQSLPVHCPMCASPSIQRQESINLNSFSRTNMATWTAIGQVAISYCEHNKCTNCGAVFEIVEREVPLAFPTLKCPTCNRAKHLKCRVKSLEVMGDAWRFTADVKCAVCGIVASLLQLLPRLAAVKKIKIGLDAFEFETHAAGGVAVSKGN